MTAQQLLTIIRRRWYALLAALVLAAVVMVALPSTPGIWYSRVDVAFVPPNGPQRIGNALEGENESIINFAAVVERQLNGSVKTLQLSSADATLYGAGIRQGFTVSLLNPGGQWQASFDRPVLRVEVVDSSQVKVDEVVKQVAHRIETIAAVDQQAADVPEDGMIRTVLTDAQPSVIFVPGSTKRSIAVLGLLGVGVGVGACVVVENAAQRRRHAVDQAGRRAVATS